MTAPSPSAIAELVRLPAVLSVPGDVIAGAAASGQGSDVRRTTALVGASSCLYLAGMALNDWADRETDAVERPNRPIPAGRVSPPFAVALAAGLTGASLLLAAVADGRRALTVAGPLVAAVWGYDLVLKRGRAATAAMCACRGLDVLMGAGAGHLVSALPSSAVVVGHTAVVTEVSRREVQGARPTLAAGALAGTATIAAAATTICVRSAATAPRRAASLALVCAYAAAVATPQAAAMHEPTPRRLQAAVGAGVLGLILLDAAFVAATGPPANAAAVAALWPIARRAARSRPVT